MPRGLGQLRRRGAGSLGAEHGPTGQGDLVVTVAVSRHDPVSPAALRAAGEPFYNDSPPGFPGLLADQDNIAANLRTYIGGSSPGAVDALEKFEFEAQNPRLDRTEQLYQIANN